LGNAAKADEYIVKMRELQSSWSSKNYQSAIRDMEVKYETEKKEHEIERQQGVISRQNMQRALLAGGIAVFAVFVGLLWYMLRLRTRRNRALTERNDTLSEMNATKDRFFSIISHDLKNPAVAQRDAIQMLVKNARLWDVDTLSEYYDELLKSADGQVQLLYNLLGWAQLQTGRMTCRPAPFDLVQELRSDIGILRKMAEDKGIRFEVDFPSDAIVTADAGMISVVVRNLLTNAVKFTPFGGSVSLSASSPLKGKCTVTVSDTGVGMTAEELHDIFRLDLHQNRRGTSGETGTGLGLIVCRELLEKHATTLHIESRENDGSKFWFELVCK
jgi:signal transduction histidine kinase